MAITPECDICNQQLEDYGGILLSPPENGKVDKFHICKDCYSKLENQLLTKDRIEAKITTDKPKR